MAYDFGSQTLGIKNPFKVEGLFKVGAGLLVLLAGVIPLLQVADTLQQDKIAGWSYAILGFVLITSGARHAGIGIFQLFRYFVGRSVPSSLAYNQSVSEKDIADEERGTNVLLYDAKQLHAMLMGRKNTTFKEPLGWMARLLHSLYPKLTFMPYPLRNLAQELAAMTINVLTALLAFGIAAFVVNVGLAGEGAKVIALPVLSILLLIYLLVNWYNTAGSITGKKSSRLHTSGGKSFGGLIALSLIAPVMAGVYLDQYSPASPQQLQTYAEATAMFNVWGNLLLLLGAIIVVLGVTLPLLFRRMAEVTPATEVSEYRENMQESVHPNEIFINIENIVLANRRYREIPNRIYRNFDPKLNEQSEGKGSFNGELIIETQPSLAKGETKHNGLKKLLTGVSQLGYLLGAYLFYLFGLKLLDVVKQAVSFNGIQPGQEQVLGFFNLCSAALAIFFAWLTISTAARVMSQASHLFWGEMHFNSLLMFMKTEGTYTESKISTGMAIHDSTRSENTVVRSSITPWVITSRIKSTIFATSGGANLESIRYIMGMNKNEEELADIVNEIKSFLRGREAIAAITNEKDLDNASQIFQVNQQTRSINSEKSAKLEQKDSDDQAAGYLRNQSPEKD
ncbi:hypothetical protein tinsulaeT_18140 [Thalassotalea insulae]|uniref:DUF304 domain-containing protein n=1 Tax=Thalassotalea insulae TaxID=2056778 RepID=A0ABQ6GTK8_9GAMM|nr:hypothetical protein [Thalassotalea insulae]GLX78474.1 hypothetical protein tinsulaeT_18140 [Thalassotalea insulae]